MANSNHSVRALRHPEKQNRLDNPPCRKPPWIRVKAPNSPVYFETRNLMRSLNLTTVCEDAACPNIGECWGKRPDGGAGHFAQVIGRIRALTPETTIEVLTPDFLGKAGALGVVVAARPDVFNHNLETVPGLYPQVRPGARYFNSLQLLAKAKELDGTLFTKSGIMVGLGEDRQAVHQVMDDLRAADVDFLTIGQYLQPTPKHHAVADFITPKQFAAYEQAARGKGFLLVAATPLTRSSYHADSDFVELRHRRQSKA